MDPDINRRIIDAAMRLAERDGWNAITLADIGTEAKVGLADLRARMPSKAAILTGLMADADQAVLAGRTEWSGSESARDRLFEVVMRRFDALRPYRRGLATVLRDLPWRPGLTLRLAGVFKLSMAWMLTAADIESPGCPGMVQKLGLTGIYLSTLRVWLEDETLDQARTMAALDGALRRAEGLMMSCGCPRHPRGGPITLPAATNNV